MYSLYAHGEDIAYGINKYIADTETDIELLPTNVAPGSSAFVISTSQTYMLNNKREWINIQSNSNDTLCTENFWKIF